MRSIVYKHVIVMNIAAIPLISH